MNVQQIRTWLEIQALKSIGENDRTESVLWEQTNFSDLLTQLLNTEKKLERK